MGKKIWLFVAMMLSLQFLNAVTVSDVRVQQRGQNRLVDIDYILAGDTSGLAVDIIVTDRVTGRIYRPTVFAVSPSASAGAHRATWNPLGDGFSVVSTDLTATVYLYRPSGGANNGPYLVVDLSGGTNAVSYPVSYLDAEPQGGWNDTYKTTKLVLCRIEAGTFTMGSLECEDVGNPQHEVTISKPFYMGIFRVTQRQWELVMGSDLSLDLDDTLPALTKFANIRGFGRWPSSSAVDAMSFFGKLRAKTGLDGFDLPTEAQWEYACRAGTTLAYNNGTVVGACVPNAWGLYYDMLNDVEEEWCLDWNVDLTSDTVIDPVGAISGWDRVRRGGGSIFDSYEYRCAYRLPREEEDDDIDYEDWFSAGFRLCCPAGLQ